MRYVTILYLLFVGCTSTYYWNISVPIHSVENNSNDSNLSVFTIEGNVYNDSLISAEWTVDIDRSILTLQNKSNNPLYIDWEQSAFIDTSYISHRIVPGDTRELLEKITIPKTIIPPKSFVKPTIVPLNDYNHIIGADKNLSYFDRKQSLEKFHNKKFKFQIAIITEAETILYTFNMSFVLVPIGSQP